MDLMIDLETYSLGPKPAIVQIGAVLFDPANDSGWQVDTLREDEIPVPEKYCFNRVVTLQSSLLVGLDFDDKTSRWWRDQSLDAQQAISGDDAPAVSLRQALSDFLSWLRAHATIDHVWSHGAASDVPWLEAALRYSYGLDTFPWRHTAVRDTRTLFWLAGLSGWEREPMRGTAHSAVWDAAAQAYDVRSAFKHLGVHGIKPLPEPQEV
jgi:hypothetical protein